MRGVHNVVCLFVCLLLLYFVLEARSPVAPLYHNIAVRSDLMRGVHNVVGWLVSGWVFFLFFCSVLLFCFFGFRLPTSDFRPMVALIWLLSSGFLILGRNNIDLADRPRLLLSITFCLVPGVLRTNQKAVGSIKDDFLGLVSGPV